MSLAGLDQPIYAIGGKATTFGAHSFLDIAFRRMAGIPPTRAVVSSAPWLVLSNAISPYAFLSLSNPDDARNIRACLRVQWWPSRRCCPEPSRSSAHQQFASPHRPDLAASEKPVRVRVA